MARLVPPKAWPSTSATFLRAFAKVNAAVAPAGPLPMTIYLKSYLLILPTHLDCNIFFILFYHDFGKYKQNRDDIF